MSQVAKILVVDDEVDLREAIVFDLERKGFQVLQAGGGVEALDIVKQGGIDIVISDVRMPKGDGIELLTKVKDWDVQKPAVILVTGFADITVADAYNLGAEAIFPKPFDRKQLHNMIENLLRPIDLRWSTRPPRFEVDLKVGVAFDNGEEVFEAKAKNIGRGGMFVAMEGPFPENGRECSFRIYTEMDVFPLIQGQGVVRWSRTRETEEKPIGCGVEFVFLQEDCRKQVVEFINFLRTRSFIPLE